MMRKEITQRMEKLGWTDPVYAYILIAAGMVFLYVSFFYFAHNLYEQFLPIPCMLFLGALHGRKTELKNKKMLILPAAMTVWFLIVWLMQGVDAERVYNIGLFFTVYLFAFPLASLLRDGEKKHALKIFAGAYLAGAAVLTAGTVLLILDFMPEYFSWAFCWDGARLQAFWHPNMTACFLMTGVIFAVAFLSESKNIWLKTALRVLIVMMLGAMALTNSRTTIILTGAYLGANLFFKMIRYGKRWYVPGVLAMVIAIVAFFAAAGQLYQLNYNRLAREYLQQQAQMATEYVPEETVGTLHAVIEIADSVPMVPVADEPDVSGVWLPTNSGQGTFKNDLGHLNGRTGIWEAAVKAIEEEPEILLWGVERPGPYVSSYNSFNIAHLHNAWLETLVGMGIVGFLFAIAFTLITAWNCLMILLKYYEDAWKRNVALLALLLMAASLLESYLFYTITDYHPYNLLFFLCAGYLAHWQEEENRKILSSLRSRIPFGK